MDWVDFYAVEGSSSPVWRVSPVTDEPVPLPAYLVADLAAWASRYDGTRAEAYDDEGRALLDRVRDALPGWRVTSTWYDPFPPSLDEPPAEPLSYGSLPRDVQIEVWLHAKHGERHPDPVVAEAAERWAHEVLGWSRWAVLLDGRLFADRRLARRLLRSG